MRDLLFLSHRIPYPPDKGEKIRAWHILNHLAQSWRIHLGFPIESEAERAYLPALQAVCAEVAAFPASRRMRLVRALGRARPGRPLMPDFYHVPALRRWVGARLAAVPFELAYVYSVAMAPYLLDRPGGAPGMRLVLDAIDIDSEKWAAYAQRTAWPARAVWSREARNLLRYERRAAMRVSATLFVSAAECARFAELAPETAERIGWVENGIDLAQFAPGPGGASPYPAGGRAVCFAGHMDYWPNIDAAAWFATEILPAIRAAVPAAEFWVVGANPGPEVQRLGSLPGVRVTGRVADVRPYVAHAEVCVAPLRIARGIQNKVLEAMAMGRPVVASPEAFEGLRVTAGRDLLVAAGAGDFAAAVGEVMAGAHPGLGTAARDAMLTDYAWPATLRRLDAVLADGCDAAGASV